MYAAKTNIMEYVHVLVDLYWIQYQLWKIII